MKSIEGLRNNYMGRGQGMLHPFVDNFVLIPVWRFLFAQVQAELFVWAAIYAETGDLEDGKWDGEP